MNPSPASAQFPSGFLWGAATSSHQVEGGNRMNDWWDWELAGKTEEPSGKACDAFVRYEEDFDIARSLHHNAHRFSIEWSRIEPEEGKWDEDALAHYAQLVRALRARGLEPVVTLHHFTNPRWLAAQGDWDNPATVAKFVRYAAKTVEALGSLVKYWITINEPMVFIYHGYVAKVWPPGKGSQDSAFRATRHMAQAHCLSYEAIHALYRALGWSDPKVGVAHAMQVYEPAQPTSWRDRFAVWLRKAVNNRLFLKLVHHDASYLLAHAFGLGGRRRALDFIGLNYYFRDVLAASKSSWTLLELMGEVSHSDERYARAEHSDLEWEIYPEGIYRVLAELKPYGLPVMITENGVCTSDEDLRRRFIRDHLRQVLRAIGDGIPVIGYHYWSLLDNFEWTFGFRPRFGLVHVDYATQKRTVKDSAYYYAKICRENRLIED